MFDPLLVFAKNQVAIQETGYFRLSLSLLAPQVAIYQITDDGICKELLDLWQKGVNVTLLVSDRIVSYNDWREAQVS